VRPPSHSPKTCIQNWSANLVRSEDFHGVMKDLPNGFPIWFKRGVWDERKDISPKTPDTLDKEQRRQQIPNHQNPKPLIPKSKHPCLVRIPVTCALERQKTCSYTHGRAKLRHRTQCPAQHPFPTSSRENLNTLRWSLGSAHCSPQ
jgi:hypothetical protein